MKNSVTLRIVLALTFLLTIMAFGGSGSAKVSHLRAPGAAEVGYVDFTVTDTNDREIDNARIDVYDERGRRASGESLFTSRDGHASYEFSYGTYTLKVVAFGFDTYTEEDFEVNAPRQDKRIELRPRIGK